MLLDFYNLKEQPFGSIPDSRFLFVGSEHRQALGSVLLALQMGNGIVSLVAPPGLGKTTLLFHVFNTLKENVTTIYIFQAPQTPLDLLRAILADLGVLEMNEDPADMLALLQDLLAEQVEQQKQVVVIIDDAQNLSPSVLQLVRMLSNSTDARSKLLQFVLSGQAQLAQPEPFSKRTQLTYRAPIVARLEPLGLEDTALYVDHRLRIAGYVDEEFLFTPEASALVARYSEGIPRKINNLCFTSLSLAYKTRRRRVEADTVRSVAADLGIDRVLQLRAVPQAPRLGAADVPAKVITMPFGAPERPHAPAAQTAHAAQVPQTSQAPDAPLRPSAPFAPPPPAAPQPMVARTTHEKPDDVVFQPVQAPIWTKPAVAQVPARPPSTAPASPPMVAQAPSPAPAKPAAPLFTAPPAAASVTYIREQSVAEPASASRPVLPFTAKTNRASAFSGLAPKLGLAAAVLLAATVTLLNIHHRQATPIESSSIPTASVPTAAPVAPEIEQPLPPAKTSSSALPGKHVAPPLGKQASPPTVVAHGATPSASPAATDLKGMKLEAALHALAGRSLNSICKANFGQCDSKQMQEMHQVNPRLTNPSQKRLTHDSPAGSRKVTAAASDRPDRVSLATTN